MNSFNWLSRLAAVLDLCSYYVTKCLSFVKRWSDEDKRIPSERHFHTGGTARQNFTLQQSSAVDA